MSLLSINTNRIFDPRLRLGILRHVLGKAQDVHFLYARFYARALLLCAEQRAR